MELCRLKKKKTPGSGYLGKDLGDSVNCIGSCLSCGPFNANCSLLTPMGVWGPGSDSGKETVIIHANFWEKDSFLLDFCLGDNNGNWILRWFPHLHICHLIPSLFPSSPSTMAFPWQAPMVGRGFERRHESQFSRVSVTYLAVWPWAGCCFAPALEFVSSGK